MNHSLPSVLLIDDEFSICTGVCGLLETEGFRADFVLSAQEALLNIDNKIIPDIVLLDVNLGSNINGIEVLKLIKEKNKYIQVVMFTSQDSLDIALECMKKGALDFLTKPLDLKLFSKVATTAMERKRTEQIKDLYFNMVIHDLKNPLQVISGAYEMLNDTLKDSCSSIQKRLLDAAENGIKQIQMIIGNVIDITNFEKKSLIARREIFDVNTVINNALTIFDAIEITYKPEKIVICSDKDLYIRVLTNIVSNASRFAVPDSKITVNLEKTNDTLITSVTNEGSYINPEVRDDVFDKFLNVHSVAQSIRGQNFGLGLTFSKMAIEAMDGKIWIEGDESIPSTTFKFKIKNYEYEDR